MSGEGDGPRDEMGFFFLKPEDAGRPEPPSEADGPLLRARHLAWGRSHPRPSGPPGDDSAQGEPGSARPTDRGSHRTGTDTVLGVPPGANGRSSASLRSGSFRSTVRPACMTWVSPRPFSRGVSERPGPFRPALHSTCNPDAVRPRAGGPAEASPRTGRWTRPGRRYDRRGS